MQVAVGLSSAVLLPVTVKVRPVMATVTRRRRRMMAACSIRADADADAGDGAMAAAEVDYSSNVSVFPMEACELVGGEACEGDMYPETKLDAGADQRSKVVPEEEVVDREYLTYDDPKTVFPDEACDDLGGEFCEPPYQMGVAPTQPS